MPRSVRVAVVCVGIFCVLYLAALAHAVLGLAGRSGPRLFDQALSVVSLGFGAVALFWTVRGLVRRRERARKGAFAVGLGVALVFGVLVPAVSAILVAKGEAAWSGALLGAAVFLLIVGPPAGVAWSLSRPSAKAWFASASPGAPAERG